MSKIYNVNVDKISYNLFLDKRMGLLIIQDITSSRFTLSMKTTAGWERMMLSTFFLELIYLVDDAIFIFDVKYSMFFLLFQLSDSFEYLFVVGWDGLGTFL